MTDKTKFGGISLKGGISIKMKQDGIVRTEDEEFTLKQLLVHWWKWVVTGETLSKHSFYVGPYTHYYYYPNQPGLDPEFGSGPVSPVHRYCNICDRVELECDRKEPYKKIPSPMEDLYEASKRMQSQRAKI